MSSLAIPPLQGPLRVLALPGSLRRASHNRLLLAEAARLAPPLFDIEIYDELGALPLFNEDLEADGFEHDPAAVRDLRARVAAADGVLIATPEYNQSVPGVLKNAIDWLSRARPAEVLAGKPVAVLGATSGRWGTRLAQAALRQTLGATEARVLPAPHLYLADARTLFDAHGALADARAQESLRALLAAFTPWIVRNRVAMAG